jgi:hypothetical protein
VVGGRLESRYRYSKDVVYNNFVFPEVNEASRDVLTGLGQGVLDARAAHPNRTLAWLYDERHMPEDLRAAHEKVDSYVEALYRADGFGSAEERVAHLLELNQAREQLLRKGSPRPGQR